MSMSVNFRLEPSLEEALHTYKRSESQRGIVVTIEGEMLRLHHGPTAKTSDFSADLAELRSSLKKVPAAFVLLRIGEKKEYAVVIVTPDGAKPKTKMLYASSALHLKNQSELFNCSEVHLENVDDLTPAAFGQPTDAEKRELMTDGEKQAEEIRKLETAPQNPSSGNLPGVAAKCDTATADVIRQFRQKAIRGFIAAIEGSAVKVEHTTPFDQPRAAVLSKLPADKPRYAVIHWDDERNQSVFVYVCPGSCKPKERMPYASMKAGFVQELSTHEVKVTKNVEVDDVSEVEASVAIHLAPQAAEEAKEAQPIAPAKVGNKGPRMLI